MTIAVLTEHEEQVGFVSEIRYLYRNDPEFMPELFYSVPNGMWIGGAGKTRFALMEKYKAEGLMPGVADVHYDQPRGGFSKFVCEMKRSDKKKEKDGGLSPEQLRYLNAVRKAGAFVCVAYCADEAIDSFKNYMGMDAGNSRDE